MNRSQGKICRVGIVGASGRLGRLIVSVATRAGFDVQALSTRQQGVDTLDITRSSDRLGRDSLLAASCAELDAVIIAAPQTSNALHRLALEAGCHVVDVGISEEVIRAVLTLDSFARERSLTVMVMAGLAPGLTGMLGQAMAQRFRAAETIDIVLLQNSQGTAGKRGVCDMLDMLSDANRSPMTQLNGGVISPSGKASQFAFALPTPESNLLRPIVQGPAIRYYTLFDAPLMNRTIRLLRVIRRISVKGYGSIRNLVATAKSKQASPTDETICLSAIANGADGSILGREDLVLASDYGATAEVAVALADIALTGLVDSGAGHPAQFTDWASVTARAFPSAEAMATLK